MTDYKWIIIFKN